MSGDKCGGECARKNGCTHFTWTTFNEGTCWMKGGEVSRDKAFETSDETMLCGIMTKPKPTTSPPSPPTPSSGKIFFFILVSLIKK